MFTHPITGRYAWGTIALLLACFATVIAAAHYTPGMPAGSPARIALALAPQAIGLLGLRLELHLWEKLDEMQRRITLECYTIAGYVAVQIGAACLLLENLGGLPRMSPMWVIGAGCLGYFGGWLYVRRKYE